MKKDITDNILNDKEYLKIVSPILNSPEFKRRKKWMHHEGVSLYEHLLIVSYLSYKICKKYNFHYKDAASGGLLHDFYYRSWQDNLGDKKPFFKQHGFIHAKEAMYNSYKFFPKYMNKRICNIILRHMFPLNIIPPRYKEGWVVTYVDKKVSMEVFVNIKAIPKYLGLSRHLEKMKKVLRKRK